MNFRVIRHMKCHRWNGQLYICMFTRQNVTCCSVHISTINCFYEERTNKIFNWCVSDADTLIYELLRCDLSISIYQRVCIFTYLFILLIPILIFGTFCAVLINVCAFIFNLFIITTLTQVVHRNCFSIIYYRTNNFTLIIVNIIQFWVTEYLLS